MATLLDPRDESLIKVHVSEKCYLVRRNSLSPKTFLGVQPGGGGGGGGGVGGVGDRVPSVGHHVD